MIDILFVKQTLHIIRLFNSDKFILFNYLFLYKITFKLFGEL